jgi:hypothetical protein
MAEVYRARVTWAAEDVRARHTRDGGTLG